MGISYRTVRAASSALLIAVALGAGGPTGMSAALAADPPAGVVFDATVTVTLPPSTVSGVTLVGATVTLDARPAGGASFQHLEATSTDDVAVVFDGVARAADGAPDVLLDAGLSFSYEVADEAGCIERGGLSGSATNVVSAADLTLDFTTLSSSVSPPDCSAVPDLVDGMATVRFIDQVTLQPVDGAEVTITVSDVDGVGTVAAMSIFTAMTDETGSATIGGLPYRPHDQPGVELAVRAHKVVSWSDAASGCSGSDSWVAERVGIAGAAAVVVEFGEAEQSASQSLTCGPKPTPSGAVLGATATPGRPALTPPPTDASAVGQPAADRLGWALSQGFIIGLIGATLVLTGRSGSRRRG